MLIYFVKMHGLGNDFVMLDRISQNLYLNTAQIQRIADRRLGIGCDQVILIEPPIQPQSDFYYRIFNADGQEVEQCGNGARCAARFVYDSGLVKKTRLLADCLAGSVAMRLEKNQLWTVNMGVPAVTEPYVPVETQVLGHDITWVAVDLGNPHAVVIVPEALAQEIPPWTWLQDAILGSGSFPNGVNIGWMRVLDRHNVRLTVLERGAGETLACGSGACAAVMAGQQLGLLDNPVSVHFSLGHLRISWSGPQTPLFMTGPASSMYQGRFKI